MSGPPEGPYAHRATPFSRWLGGEKLGDDEGKIINAGELPVWIGCMSLDHARVPFMFKVPNDHTGDIICPECGRTQKKPG